MDFSAWCQANGFDLSTATAEQKAQWQRWWRADQKPAAAAPAALPVAQLAPQTPAPASPPAAPTQLDAKFAAIEAENARQEHIRRAAEAMALNHVGNGEKVKQIKELRDAALADTKTDTRDFDLALLRLDRFAGPMVFAPSQPEVTADVIEAALCVAHGLKAPEKHFSERTLDAARKRFKGGMSLCNLVHLAARQAGYRGDIGGPANLLSMWQQAVRHKKMGGEPMMGGGSGLSTIDIDGILSNTANKFLTTQFLYGEQSWRQVARVRPVNDFKQITTYRLTGNNKFVKVPPGGQIQHGTLSELSYTNQADTYGIMLGIDRRDFINDDLGALNGRAAEVGQGAIDSLNEVFYTEWLDDSTFFPTDKSLNNYDDGATDSVLSLAGLDNAYTIFGRQTKPNGTPLGARPAVLFVPIELESTANNLMASVLTAAAQSTPTVGLTNIWQNKFKVVPSVYLSNSAITGYSATAWYLLADPANIAGIEVVFLFGRDMPVIEETELDFDRLGMSMRAYMDWGCNKQESRCGVKLKGAA